MIDFFNQLTNVVGIFNVQKKILKGAKAGEASYSRRENIFVYPLTIVENTTATTKTVTAVETPKQEEPVVSTTEAAQALFN